MVVLYNISNYFNRLSNPAKPFDKYLQKMQNVRYYAGDSDEMNVELLKINNTFILYKRLF